MIIYSDNVTGNIVVFLICNLNAVGIIKTAIIQLELEPQLKNPGETQKYLLK